MAHNILIAYYSGTKSRIGLKPGRKFKFVCRQKVFVKKYQFVTTLEGSFSPRVPQNQPRTVHEDEFKSKDNVKIKATEKVETALSFAKALPLSPWM